MKHLKRILLFLFLIMLLYSIFSIYRILREENRQQQIKEELIEEFDIPEIPSEEPEFTIDFDSLKQINSDIVGWIIIEGTQVNYPIVQGSNNSYYLTHSYDKKYSSFGSIFMDYSSSADFSDKNTFIYGHHTRNGSMFGEVYKYMDVNFYNEHPFFFLYTPNENYKVEVFSVYTADALSDSYDQSFASSDEFKQYIDKITKKSKYNTDIDVDYKNDRIISLYSCSRETGYTKYERYFIHGKLVEIN